MSTRAKQFDSKAPAEIVPITFDFSALLTSIDSVVISVQIRVGADPNVASMPLAAPVINGGVVQQLIQQGVDGVEYSIRADAVAGMQKYALNGHLPVIELS